MMTHPQYFSQQVPLSRHGHCFPQVYRQLQGVYCRHGWSLPLAILFRNTGRATDFHVYFSFRTLPLRRPPYKRARVAASISWFNTTITLVKSCSKTDFCKFTDRRCQDDHSSGAKLVKHNIDISNSTWLLVPSWLFYIQDLPISVWRMLGGSVEVWAMNILYWSIEGHINWGMWRGAKMNLALNEPK